jgi:serine/threonine-protein kinase
MRSSTVSGNEDEGRFVPGTLVAGRYRVIGLLGRGGMGEVYRATDLTLGQSVALKFLPEDAARDERLLSRFHNEVRTARQVTHPNVCRVYDIGEADGFPFISMEYVDGEDLASLLPRIGRVPSSKALEITRKLCLGLAAAHDRGIIHRDLKPQNIMLNKRGDVVIMDFGLAAIADQLVGAEARSGTVAYMAPEQLRGDSVTASSDIYSLGLIAYELFTGRRAFDGDSILDRLHAEETTLPAPIASIAPDVDPAIEEVIFGCLQPDPRQRPASARAVVAALPGGDPLLAALAAGETPSPELVAASGKAEGMRLRYAVACLVAVLLGLLALPSVTPPISLYANAPMDYPPAVLEQKARDMASSFGVTAPAVDWKSRFQTNWSALDYMFKHRDGESWSNVFRAVPPVELWYRQSPEYLIAPPDGLVLSHKPALDRPGMLYVLLDSRGRLRQFEAVAARFESSSAAARPAVDPAAVFTAAGFDIRAFHEVTPAYTPVLAFDERRAWRGPYPGRADASITVELATWRGSVTSFFVAWPWTRTSDSPTAQDRLRTAFTMFYFVMCGIGLFCAVFFARRNLRLGRGDRKGATRIAFATFLIGSAEGAAMVQMVPVFDVIGFLFNWLSGALMFTAVVWLLYIALEPAIRARWPHTLITWSRLTAGEWRHPAVASHVLVGVTFGVVCLILFLSRTYLNDGPPFGPEASLLGGVRPWLAKLCTRLSNALFWGPAIFFLLCGVRAIVRNNWLTIVIASVLMTFVEGSVRNSDNLAVDVPLYFSLYVAFAFMLLRAGLLPFVVSIFVLNTFSDTPVSGSFGAWFNWIAAVQISILAVLAIYAFIRSQASMAIRTPSSAWRSMPRPAHSR